MNRHSLPRRAALLGAFVLAALSTSAFAATLELAGDFHFTSKAPMETIEGTGEGATGTLTLDLADLTKTTGFVRVSTDALKTGSEIRDGHLKGDDWLNAKAFPELRFDITSVEVASQETKGEVSIAKCKVNGTFTLHGVSKPLTAKATFKWKGARAKVDVRFKLRLKHYGIKGQEGVIGSKVGKTIRVRGSLKGAIK